MTEKLAAAPILVSFPKPHVALVTINRPEAANAVNGDVARALETTVEDIEARDDVWVAVMAGAGERAFCAGADLSAVSRGEGGALFTEKGGFAGFVFAERRKVWIAAVDAPALAGGFEIALACDIIVASEAARFGLPEVKRGLVAIAGGVYRAPRALPRHVALHLIATGEPMSAQRAAHFGVVSVLCPKGEAIATALRVAEEITENAPIAVRESLAIARAADDVDEAGLRALSAAAGAKIRSTEDFQEGPRAFVEKRKPRWSGR